VHDAPLLSGSGQREKGKGEAERPDLAGHCSCRVDFSETLLFAPSVCGKKTIEHFFQPPAGKELKKTEKVVQSCPAGGGHFCIALFEKKTAYMRACVADTVRNGPGVSVGFFCRVSVRKEVGQTQTLEDGFREK